MAASSDVGSKSTACFRTTRTSGEPAGRRLLDAASADARQFALRCRVRSSATRRAGSLTVLDHRLEATFSALNSVQPGGIHPIPDQFTGGNGAVTGEEVEFNVSFTDAVCSSPPTIISSCLRSRSRTPTAISSGCRRRRPITGGTGPFAGRPAELDPRCKRSIPTGCASARTSRAAPGAVQRGVLAHRLRGSRAFDLGHDAARLRGPWFRRLSAGQKGAPRERMSRPKAAEAAFG